ncbi:MAG: glycosyltransferase family 2 protein [Thermoproteota archaeon]
MSSPRISVVILNYNGMRFLETCLKSLLSSTYRDFEIILVDNGSRDGSVEYLKESFSKEPRLKIIPLRKNYGFAMGNNIGYKYTNPNSEFVFFLNNDTEVENDCLEKIIRKMENDDSIGAAQPKIRRMTDRGKIDAVGGIADYYGRTWHRGSGEYDYGQYDSVSETFYAQGAAIVVRRKVINEIGLFEPAYFIYYEETDLCWRIWLAGYRVVVIPEAVVYHYGGGTIVLPSTYHEKYFKLKNLRKNHIATMLKNYSLTNISKYTVPFIIRMILAAFRWSLSGEKAKAMAYYYALWWVFSNMSLIVRRRMFIQKMRKITDKELMKIMSPPVVWCLYQKEAVKGSYTKSS